MCLAVLCVGLSLAQAAPPKEVQAEIQYLLNQIESSRCEFYRNGHWYDASRARMHLQSKYDYLLARDQIGSVEEFIDKAGTRSSLSGVLYQMRCPGAEPIPAHLWLRAVFAKYRAATDPR